MLVTVALGDGWQLFTRPAWLDEYHTLLAAGQPSLASSITALAHGADFNPPLLTVLVRAVGHISGGLDLSGRHMLPLRLFAFTCVWLALVLAALLLRSRYGAFASVASAFVIWTDPLMLEQSFEARFYAPWLLLTACFATVLVRWPRERAVSRALLIGISAACLCLIHYFGIITWGLVLLGYFLAHRRESRQGETAPLVASLAGPLGLVACLPLYLGQRAVLSVPTWLPPVTLLGVVAFLLAIFGRALLIAASARLLSLVAFPAGPQGKPDAHGSPETAGAATLLGLGMLPLILIVFSVLVQPSMLDKYAIVAMFGGIPVVAWALTRIPRRWQFAMVVPAVMLARAVIASNASKAATETSIAAALRDAIKAQVITNDLVVVNDRNFLYTVALASPYALAARMVFTDFGDSMLTTATAFEVVERDVARVQSRLFGFPTMQSVEDTRATSRFYLADSRDDTRFSARWYPDHQVKRVAPHLFELTLPARTESTAVSHIAVVTAAHAESTR